jgi:hypothetical protein
LIACSGFADSVNSAFRSLTSHEDEAGHASRCDVIDEVLHPSEVSVAARGRRSNLRVLLLTQRESSCYRFVTEFGLHETTLAQHLPGK